MTIFRAELETRHFSFEAYGESAASARAAMRQGLIDHKGADSNDISELMESVEVYPVEAGKAYRDHTEIKARP